MWRATARRWPSGSPRRPPTSCSTRPAHARGRLRLRPGRRYRRRRGTDLRLDSGPADGGARGGGRRPRRRAAVRYPDGTSSTVRSTLQLREVPADEPGWTQQPAPACWPLAPRAPSRPVTHRSSPPGTALPSRRSPKPGPAGRPQPRYLDAARDAPASSWRPTSSTAGCAAPPATASSAPPWRWPTTTATWPRACWPCTRRPAVRDAGRGGRLVEVALEHFRRRGGRLLRHRGRRRGAVHAPPQPGRQRQPAGTSAIAGAPPTYAALTGSARHREAADPRRSAGARDPAPRFAGWTLAVAEAAAAGPLQVAVVVLRRQGRRAAGRGAPLALPRAGPRVRRPRRRGGAAVSPSAPWCRAAPRRRAAGVRLRPAGDGARAAAAALARCRRARPRR